MEPLLLAGNPTYKDVYEDPDENDLPLELQPEWRGIFTRVEEPEIEQAMGVLRYSLEQWLASPPRE